VNAYLLKNGLKYCDVLEPQSSLVPDETGVVTVFTSLRALPFPGDVFELVNPDVRFPVTILRSHVKTNGWETAILLSSNSQP
jgi:hypothetical protein